VQKFGQSGHPAFSPHRDSRMKKTLDIHFRTFIFPRSYFSSSALGPGLPDGLFSNQKSEFGSILERLAIENLGIFLAIWYI
jgi:hypothetical protein